MTANSKFPCAINPKTGKPYSKHKWVSDLSVYGHYRGAYGDDKPLFNNTVSCAREGCTSLPTTRRYN